MVAPGRHIRVIAAFKRLKTAIGKNMCNFINFWEIDQLPNRIT
ncbi:hypothetical protein CES86_2086 [Brucella lupini]|uniref:Uncharacterized protein n=1 Tax=Brucella lupini TaxID=255457 RepID=A0A256GQP4_9HYPH|nr:hypothetical protein CES86_2086 [Brucella lupini]